jgi:hypothetical protein
MRLIFALLISLVATLPAQAISRYNSTALDCSAIKAAIADEGAVILRHPGKSNPGLTVYDRYVRNAGYCDSHEMAERVSVPAADTPRCRVLHCIDRPDDMERPFWRPRLHR